MIAVALDGEGLRRRALERLGAHGHELAERALEDGVVELEPSLLQWEGSGGTVHAHGVVLRVAGALADEVNRAHAALDALTAAFAAAIATVPGNALAELSVVAAGAPARSSPYRGRV